MKCYFCFDAKVVNIRIFHCPLYHHHETHQLRYFPLLKYYGMSNNMQNIIINNRRRREVPFPVTHNTKQCKVAKVSNTQAVCLALCEITRLPPQYYTFFSRSRRHHHHHRVEVFEIGGVGRAVNSS